MPIQEESKENLDWTRIEGIKKEMVEIFNSIKRNLDTIKGMTEIAQERNFSGSSELQDKADEVLKKFEPYGEYAPILYKMIGDLGSVTSGAYSEGLLVTADELNNKLEEIKGRE